MREADMSENKQRPAALFIGIAFAILFLIVAIATLIIAREQRWGLERLIIFELALLSGLLLSLLFAKFFEGILLWIASMRATQWLLSYDAKKSARTSEEVTESSLPLPDASKDRPGARGGGLTVTVGSSSWATSPW
jgi:type VI secretion system protein ImpL